MKPLRLSVSGSIVVVVLTLAVALMQLSTGNTTETFAAPAAPTAQVDVHGPAGSG